jgi:hypothetical protein
MKNDENSVNRDAFLETFAAELTLAAYRTRTEPFFIFDPLRG